MVRLTITSALVDAIKAVYGNGRDDAPTESINAAPLGNAKIGDPITHSQILAISKALKKRHALPLSHSSQLDDLLRGCRVYQEPLKPRAEPVRLIVTPRLP